MTKSVAALMLSAAAALGIGTALAPAARADPGSYLAELDGAGVSYRDPPGAIHAGLSICQGLETGSSFDAAVDSVKAVGYSAHDAGFIVGAAVRNLCPDLLPAMSRWLNPPPPYTYEPLLPPPAAAG